MRSLRSDSRLLRISLISRLREVNDGGRVRQPQGRANGDRSLRREQEPHQQVVRQLPAGGQYEVDPRRTRQQAPQGGGCPRRLHGPRICPSRAAALLPSPSTFTRQSFCARPSPVSRWKPSIGFARWRNGHGMHPNFRASKRGMPTGDRQRCAGGWAGGLSPTVGSLYDIGEVASSALRVRRRSTQVRGLRAARRKGQGDEC